MDLLAFERKLDSTIMRKRLDIQEALKRPMKQKRKLRIFISNTSFPAREGEGSVASWELRVEGRLIDDDKRVDPAKTKRKFSSFFKSLVIELDKDLYGPDNHLVEWHRTPTTQETDGFQVYRMLFFQKGFWVGGGGTDFMNKKVCKVYCLVKGPGRQGFLGSMVSEVTGFYD